jgi:hypothetical protein
MSVSRWVAVSGTAISRGELAKNRNAIASLGDEQPVSLAQRLR